VNEPGPSDKEKSGESLLREWEIGARTMRVGGKSQSAEHLSRDWRPGAGAGKIDKKIGSENGKIGSPMRAGKSRAETET
jgi:hypothetical protein